jgi:hypothetical protein
MTKKKGKSILILCCSFILFVLLLFCQLPLETGNRQVVQGAIAKDTKGNTANSTGQSASQSAEALVRSIMDPSSLMSSVMNETGVGKTGNLSSISGLPHSKSPARTSTFNATEQSGGLSKSSIPASPSLTSSSPSSTGKGRLNNSSGNASLSFSKDTTVRNIDTLFLAHQIIPPKDFIPLYDTSPYQILKGHLAAKLPCDANSKPSLQILVGHLPNVRPVEPQLIKEFSQPGYICMYNVDINASKTTTTGPVPSGNNNENKTAVVPNPIDTDVVLHNPTDSRVLLPNTSTVVIGVDEANPLNMETTNNDSSSNVQAATSTNNVSSEQNQGQISHVIRSMSELNK